MIVDFFTDSNNKKATYLSVDGKHLPLKKCTSVEITCSAGGEKYVEVKATYGNESVKVFNDLNDKTGD